MCRASEDPGTKVETKGLLAPHFMSARGMFSTCATKQMPPGILDSERLINKIYNREAPQEGRPA